MKKTFVGGDVGLADSCDVKSSGRAVDATGILRHDVRFGRMYCRGFYKKVASSVRGGVSVAGTEVVSFHQAI